MVCRIAQAAIESCIPYDILGRPFRSTFETQKALRALDNCLNSFLINRGRHGDVAPGGPLPRGSIKFLVHLTAKALAFSHSFYRSMVKNDYEDTDVLIAHLFCHWDVLLREVIAPPEKRDFDRINQDCIDIFSVLADCFAKYVRDMYNILGKCGKHAVLFCRSPD
jgi:hypothetical protein